LSERVGNVGCLNEVGQRNVKLAVKALFLEVEVLASHLGLQSLDRGEPLTTKLVDARAKMPARRSPRASRWR
jgi:hypothetical protein